MASIGKLYLDYFPRHPNEAKFLVKNQTSIFQEAKGLIRTNYTESLIKHLNLPLETYEEWLSICWKRTNLEACHVLFEDLIDKEDLEKVEEVMQEKLLIRVSEKKIFPKMSRKISGGSNKQGLQAIFSLLYSNRLKFACHTGLIFKTI